MTARPEETKERGNEDRSEIIMAEHFPKLMTDLKPRSRKLKEQKAG